jgi:plasmid segregation protein ParM
MIYHGVNIGHGFVKYIALDQKGNERSLPPFPAIIAPARNSVGTLQEAPTTEHDGVPYWVGEHASLSPTPTTFLAQERLTDPVFLPVLLRTALHRLHLTTAPGPCVTCLPATWARDKAKCQALGAQLRTGAGQDYYPRIKVIPEPVALLCAVALDNSGAIIQNELVRGTVGIVDLGHHTVNVAAVHNLHLVDGSLHTWNIGSSRPLNAIASTLSAHFERELSLHDADQVVRSQAILIRGETHPLPHDWDAPLHENGQAIATKLQEVWGAGTHLDAILIGGGGAALPQVVQHIRTRFPQSKRVQDPQQVIALGCARFARRLEG